MSLNHENATNEDFNISIAKETKIIDLAKLIWRKIYKNDNYNFDFDEPFSHDVQRRIPDVNKAKNLLGFEAKTSLEDIIIEIIDWLKINIKL